MNIYTAAKGDWRPTLMFCLLLAGGSFARAAKWDPVPAADLAAKESATFPGANAEILLSEHSQRLTGGASVFEAPAGHSPNPGPVLLSMNMGDREAILESFVRMKIYTVEGASDQRRIVVEQLSAAPSDGSRMSSAQGQGTFLIDRCGLVEKAQARVVKPGGRSIELAKPDIKWGSALGADDRVVSFDFPALEPGDVVEYRWTRKAEMSQLRRLIPYQQSLPLREYRLVIDWMQPTRSVPRSILMLNCAKVEQAKRADGGEVVVRDFPAFEPEEYMSGLWDYRGWIYPQWTYRKDELMTEDERWATRFDEATVPTKIMKAKAGELIAGAETDDEKLRRLYEFCRNAIENSDWVRSPEVQKKSREQQAWRERTSKKYVHEFLREERGQQAWREKTSGYTSAIVRTAFGERTGDSEMIDLIFAALARGAGFSVRKTRSAERGFFAARHDRLGRFFLDRGLVAVEVDGQWRFCSPGSHVVPYGMIPAVDEAVLVVWSGASHPGLPLQTPVAAAALSLAQRKARLDLDAEGTLQGEVEENLTGHLAIALKQRFGREAEADVTKWLSLEVSKRLPTAEVSAVEFTNLRTRELPLTIRYHVRVPDFAGKAGQRLVVAPSYFEAGEPVVFTAAERKYPISFPHAWSEHDAIEIVMPEGFVLDQPSAPAPVADSTKLGASYTLEYQPQTRTLSYRREFAVGGNGVITFPVRLYPALKKLFDQVSASDSYSFLLVRGSAPGS